MTKNKPTYSDKLRDPRWQKKRLEILERDMWCCQNCGDSKKTLHVHHRRYLKAKDPWDVPCELLISLCEDCHEQETFEMDERLQDLCIAIKEKFLSADVYALYDGFSNLQLPHNRADIFASVIKYWFSAPDKVKQMYDEYFNYLHKNGDDLPF